MSQRRPLPVVALLALLSTAAPGAASESDTRAELARVQARIRKVTESVHAEAATRDEAAAALRSADEALKTARERLEAARAANEAAGRRLATLKHDRAVAAEALDAARDQLRADLAMAYRNGRAAPLKLMLNADDPVLLGRMLSYYAYVGAARTARINRIEQDLAKLAALDADLSRQASELRRLADAQENEVRGLHSARLAHERALAAVEADLDSKSSELARLRGNAASLEKLLRELREALKDVPAEDYAAAGHRRQPFEKVRGKLPWPARGTVVAQYGSSRPGGLVWQGLLLDTEPGTPVHAPYYGRVVYADWLPGLGLLVILDHGSGYLTLYGNNARLYRKVGDSVAPGEVLAASAAEAGAMASQLYFEVRRGKEAEDPRRWLRPLSGRN